jgi:hypothetical protein
MPSQKSLNPGSDGSDAGAEYQIDPVVCGRCGGMDRNPLQGELRTSNSIRKCTCRR